MPGKQLSHGSHRGPGSHTASRPPSPRSLSTLSAPTLGIAPQCSHQQGPSCQQLKASTRYWAGQQPPRLRDEDQLAWSHGQPGTEARSLVMVPCSGPSRETCRCGLSRVHTRSQHGMWGDNPRERAARARADTRIRVHSRTLRCRPSGSSQVPPADSAWGGGGGTSGLEARSREAPRRPFHSQTHPRVFPAAMGRQVAESPLPQAQAPCPPGLIPTSPPTS